MLYINRTVETATRISTLFLQFSQRLSILLVFNNHNPERYWLQWLYVSVDIHKHPGPSLFKGLRIKLKTSYKPFKTKKGEMFPGTKTACVVVFYQAHKISQLLLSPTCAVPSSVALFMYFSLSHYYYWETNLKMSQNTNLNVRGEKNILEKTDLVSLFTSKHVVQLGSIPNTLEACCWLGRCSSTLTKMLLMALQSDNCIKKKNFISWFKGIYFLCFYIYWLT